MEFVHRDTLFFSLLCAAIVLVVLRLAARKATPGIPGKFQAAVEMVNEQANALVKGNTSYTAGDAVACESVAPFALTRVGRELPPPARDEVFQMPREGIRRCNDAQLDDVRTSGGIFRIVDSVPARRIDAMTASVSPARPLAASVERARKGAPAHELHRLGALLGEGAERLHHFLVQAYFLV